MTQPRLLLMDEPLSALDGEARAGLLDHVEALLRHIAIPTFYVTHDEAEAARFCTRSIRLRHGRVERTE
jgi:molybdate transport system ATP-binding protein